MTKKMIYSLNKFESWILKKIILKLVRERNQDILFNEIYNANRYIFYEDNHFTYIENMRDQINNLDQYKLMRLREKYG